MVIFTVFALAVPGRKIWHKFGSFSKLFDGSLALGFLVPMFPVSVISLCWTVVKVWDGNTIFSKNMRRMCLIVNAKEYLFAWGACEPHHNFAEGMIFSLNYDPLIVFMISLIFWPKISKNEITILIKKIIWVLTLKVPWSSQLSKLIDVSKHWWCQIKILQKNYHRSKYLKKKLFS